MPTLSYQRSPTAGSYRHMPQVWGKALSECTGRSCQRTTAITGLRGGTKGIQRQAQEVSHTQSCHHCRVCFPSHGAIDIVSQIIPCCGAVPCIVGSLVPWLASTPCMPVTSSLPAVATKISSAIPNYPLGGKATTGAKYWISYFCHSPSTTSFLSTYIISKAALK